jgi:hypothetical protein
MAVLHGTVLVHTWAGSLAMNPAWVDTCDLEHMFEALWC